MDVDTPTLRTLKQHAGIADCPQASGGHVDSGLPTVTLPCLGGGRPVNLAGLRGPAVVNLWAQWCGPCRTELPIYQRLHEQAGGRLRVIGVDYQDTQPEAALRLAERSGVTYPLLADPSSLLQRNYRLRGLPFVLFVDAQGHVTDSQYVAITSYAQLRGLVQQHLGVDL